MAFTAPITFLFTQGTSTSPATGSQTRPKRLFKAKAQALALCSIVPPLKYTSVALAIADAEPISA